MNLKRTHFCGDLKKNNVGEEVILMGWSQPRRDHGGVIFVDLRDITGMSQIVFKKEISLEAHKLGDEIRNEYVIAIKGKVDYRLEGNINENLSSGEIEVLVNKLEILSKSETPPFVINNRDDVDEKLRLKYRFLELRNRELQKNLILRSKAMNLIRNYFSSNGFFEIETPILTKSTPEGARDYLVPSRVNAGMFYALPQSPQIFKLSLIHI